MENILFTQYSLGRFAPAILALVLAVYILSTNSRGSKGRFLGLYFAAAFIFHLGYLIGYSLYSPAGTYGWHLAALAPFGLTFMIQFAYRFPEKVFAKEARTVFAATTILSIYAFTDYAWKAAVNPFSHTETGYGSTYASMIIPVLVSIFFLWTIIVFFRQAAAMQGNSFLHGLKNALTIIFRPRGREASAARNFGFLVFFEMLNTFSVVLFMLFDALSHPALIVSMNLAFPVIYTLYAAVYLNSGAAGVPVLHKAVGITSAAVILSAGLIGSISINAADRAYREKTSSELRFIKSIIRTGDFPYLPDQVEYIIRCGPSGCGSGREWGSDPMKADSALQKSTSAADRALTPQGGSDPTNPPKTALTPKKGSDPIIFLKSQNLLSEGPLLLWDIVPGISQKFQGRGTVIPHKEDGIRYFASSNDRSSYFYTVESRGALYGVGFSYLAYRKSIHRTAFSLIAMISAITIVLLAGFPVLFHFGLAKPIQGLLEEVKEAMGADDEGIEAPVSDELEYLTESISGISASISDRKRLFLENIELKNRIMNEKIRKDTLTDSSVVKINTAIVYLDENFKYDISREGLAAHVNMSPDRFGKAFKYYTGKKIGDYVNELRIREALTLLENEEKTVLEIAFEVGFESLRTFNRAFQKNIGMSPSDYR
jgi:AraC-like DNA-binding protein